MYKYLQAANKFTRQSSTVNVYNVLFLRMHILCQYVK